MNSILVTYDLRGRNETSEDYAKLISAIKAYGDVIKPLYSVWLIGTTWTAKEIRNDLQQHIDASDRMLVFDVTDRYWAAAHLETGDGRWLKSHIP